MNKYIDADHLKVEIEKYIKEVKDANGRFTPNIGFFDAKLSGIYEVMDIIDSLNQEQSEIDWEKELRNWMVEMDGKYALLTTDYVDRLIIDTAKHFYELGLNARKEG